MRSLEGEKDKDEDSCAETSKHVVLPVDLPAVRRAFTALFKLKTSIFENALINALVTLAGNLQMELPTRKERENQDDIVNVLLIVFEIPALGETDSNIRYTFLNIVLPCRFWRLSGNCPSRHLQSSAVAARGGAGETGQDVVHCGPEQHQKYFRKPPAIDNVTGHPDAIS